jgi:hypothetical protein
MIEKVKICRPLERDSSASTCSLSFRISVRKEEKVKAKETWLLLFRMLEITFSQPRSILLVG